MLYSIGTMITNRQAIQGFRDFASGRGMLSDDNTLSSRLVLYFLKMYRARLLYERRISKGRTISKYNVQTIPCIPLIEIDQDECPCTPNSGCTFLRTKYPIPRPVGDLITTVSSVGGDITYSPVRWDKFKRKLQSRIPAQRSGAFYTFKDTGEGTHIYVYNDEHKEYIAVSAIFDDSDSVKAFPKCDGTVDNMCTPYEMEFVIDGDIMPLLYELVFDKLTKYRQTSTEDKLNNDADESTGLQSPIK